MKTRILWASLALAGGLLLVLLLTRALAVQAQEPMADPPGTWTKYDGNPVVVTGTVGSWEANGVGDPTVISDGLTYKMWYTGIDDSVPINIASIGYVTSTNGITWTKYFGNPVLQRDPSFGSWEFVSVGGSDVVFDGATYHMWYSGANIAGIFAIGYTTSTDGISWSKYSGNPVLQKGTLGSWDESGILCPCVISDTGLYKMWYMGVDASDIASIGYATSTHGISWSKYSGNPVLQKGLSGSWDESWVFCPDVILDGTTYKMWYTGQDADETQRIGYATSSDGISWNKSARNPVLSGEDAPGSWEFVVMNPAVLLEGDTYKMWYTGRYTKSQGVADLGGEQIGYASASATPFIPTYLPIIMRDYSP